MLLIAWSTSKLSISPVPLLSGAIMAPDIASAASRRTAWVARVKPIALAPLAGVAQAGIVRFPHGLLIEGRGASARNLSAYSLDLNSIELAFDKLTHISRSTEAHTVDRLWTLLGQRLQRSPAEECGEYLRHCRYGYTMCKEAG